MEELQGDLDAKSVCAKTEYERRLAMWINVKNRLPGDCDRTIVYPNKYHDTAAYHHYGKYAGKWTVDDENGYECEVVVTHWMPFPSPPTADNVEGANLQHTTAQV